MGRPASRLSERAGTPVHPRQRADVARGTPSGRAALGRDQVHTHNVYGDKNNLGANLDDGWRLMKRVNTEMDRRLPWKLSIAEDMWNDEQIAQAVDFGGAGFDAQWDAGFVHTVRGALIRLRMRHVVCNHCGATCGVGAHHRMVWAWGRPLSICCGE